MSEPKKHAHNAVPPPPELTWEEQQKLLDVYAEDYCRRDRSSRLDYYDGYLAACIRWGHLEVFKAPRSDRRPRPPGSVRPDLPPPFEALWS